MSSFQDNSLQLGAGHTSTTILDDGRMCHRVEVSPTEIYFCYAKYDPEATADLQLSDSDWKIVFSDGAGGYKFPEKQGGFGWDPGYNFPADDPANLTYFTPA